MPVKFKKSKKRADIQQMELGLRGFPVISESGDQRGSTDSGDDILRQNVSTTHKKNTSVPKIPTSFYNKAIYKTDALSHELDLLNGPWAPIPDGLSDFLQELRDKIFADKTWLATYRDGDAACSITSCDSIQNVINADNGLVAHAMSIDHLMFIKNKIYIDELLDNRLGLTSLFIVPVNTDDTRGMVLAGYKSPKGELRSIVAALNECRTAAAEYL